MKQTLTTVCKLSPTPEQAQKLDQTLVAFADACNYVNETVNPKIKNKNRIQNAYTSTPKKESLTAPARRSSVGIADGKATLILMEPTISNVLEAL